MNLKKNPKADLRSKSTLFFQVGLILVLLLTWGGIEYKTYDRQIIEEEDFELVVEEEEDIPITKMVFRKPPPPPPPPPSIEIIEVIDDKEPEPETVFEETDVEEEEDIPDEVPDFTADEGDGEEEIGDVPFALISESPTFPGCEKERGNAAKKACMEKKIQKFVNRKFNTDLGSELGLSGVQRIFVMFKIDKKGDIVDVRARAPHPRLMKEAQRVVSLLPKMKPGKQRDKTVGVLYNLPITFRVED
ncbi:energy transducer TonB [Aquimarina agarilytica]|uniref:energy transducer TonB n=1 Tax=Aquimarina agarilytica TaxID=1087449 RepID=UPI000289C00C|nr:energy transducer TonB [Aquimarina agarilytica]